MPDDPLKPTSVFQVQYRHNGWWRRITHYGKDISALPSGLAADIVCKSILEWSELHSPERPRLRVVEYVTTAVVHHPRSGTLSVTQVAEGVRHYVHLPGPPTVLAGEEVELNFEDMTWRIVAATGD